MKINKNSFYKTLFIVVLLSQMYLPSFKTNIFLQIGVLFIYLGLEKTSFSVRFLKEISPILLIVLLGFIGMIFYSNPIGFSIKDFFHFIKPIQGLLIGYFFLKAINNKKTFTQTIVNTGLISAIIHFFILLFFADVSSGSVSEIRMFTKDNFLELMAIFFIGYYKFFFNEELFNSKRKKNIIFMILLISCILYLSRTMMVGAFIFFLSIKGYSIITKKTIRIVSVSFLGIILLYSYLYSVKIERGKPGIEALLYKIKIAPEELFKTKINRENHEDLWDHWRGYEAKRAFALMNDNSLSYIIGTGYGSLINLKFKAPLGDSKDDGMKYISELHNGYVYVLYKVGVIGLILYLVFLIKLYRSINYDKSFETIFISALGLFYIFTTLTITGIYNTNDTTIFVLGALLLSQEKTKNAKEIISKTTK